MPKQVQLKRRLNRGTAAEFSKSRAANPQPRGGRRRAYQTIVWFRPDGDARLPVVARVPVLQSIGTRSASDPYHISERACGPHRLAHARTRRREHAEGVGADRAAPFMIEFLEEQAVARERIGGTAVIVVMVAIIVGGLSYGLSLVLVRPAPF